MSDMRNVMDKVPVARLNFSI